jgi:amino acid permease
MFAFTCQVNVFSIYEELERKGERRMKRVSNGAVTVCFIAYLLMGTMGYLDFGPNTQSNILKNYCVRKNPSPLIIASFICITITIIMAFPLNIFPMRYTVEVILARQGQGQKSGSEEVRTEEHRCNPSATMYLYLSTYATFPRSSQPLLMEEGVSADVNDDLGVSMASSKDATFTVDALETSDDSSISGNLRHFLLTGLITGSALLVALVTPNISVVFQLMGGTTSAFVCFVLPAAFALKLGFTKGTGLHAPTWGLAVGGVLVGAISTVVTLIGIAYPEETKDAVC